MSVPFSGAHLLYRSATGFEKALADVDSQRITDIYAEAIIDVWDPYAIQYKHLPFLAWALGVNLWEEGWHELTQRTWTARQWEFKSLRGTEAGIRMAIDYVGRDQSPFGYQVRKITAPPQAVYSGPSLTREQREAWLATLPQIRVWRIQEPGFAQTWKAFYGGHDATVRKRDARFCLGGPDAGDAYSYIIPSTALERLHRRARYILNGVETDTKVTEFGNYWRVHIRGHVDHKVFVSMPIRPGKFFVPSDAHSRLITIEPKMRLAWRSPVYATMEPISAEPERVVINGVRDHKTFCDTIMRWRAFYMPSDAWRRIFWRFAINNGTPITNRRRPVQFMGVGRYGFPKYTAWVSASLRSIKPRWQAGEGFPRGKYWKPHDPTPVLRARRAVEASRKLVDRVLLELGPVPRFVAGRPFIAGADEFIVGHL